MLACIYSSRDTGVLICEDVLNLDEKTSVDTSSLYSRGCTVISRQGGARQKIHRPPRHTPELVMKHRPFKAVDISFNHDGRMTEAFPGVP